MKFPRKRVLLLTPVVLFAMFYFAGFIVTSMRDDSVPIYTSEFSGYPSIAIFGASGTAGDGILEAALADPTIDTIYVVTRRETSRMTAGVDSGKVQLILHQDYLDYSAIVERFADVDSVYWAIGISSIGMDQPTYAKIHVDFPKQFVVAWNRVAKQSDRSFHYISSSDISEDSGSMWAREKIRAENTLFKLADNSALRVIAYRPDYIGPTEAEAHLGQELLYWFFAPVHASVRATHIGQAMLEVTARSGEFANGSKLGTSKIRRYSGAYEARLIPTVTN